MRYLILLLLIGVQAYTQSLDELEDMYIKKATSLEEDYKKKSVSLAKSYVKALENKEKEIVKSGNLDEALKVRSKIKEIKSIIGSGDNKPEVIPDKEPTKTTGKSELIEGKWFWVEDKTRFWQFNEDGTISGIRKGQYRMHSDRTFSLSWAGKRFEGQHTISKDGKEMAYKGVVFAVRKE